MPEPRKRPPRARLRAWAVGQGMRFRSDRAGAVAILFALMSVTLVGIVGAGVEYARLLARRSDLQNAVDAGVMAGGNALKLVASDAAAIAGVTEQTIRDTAKPPADRAFSVAVTVADDRTSVTAQVREVINLNFAAFIGLRTTTVSVQSQAKVVGRMRLCMLILDPSAAGAFNLQKNAEVTASNCSLYSNSSSQSGLIGGDRAMAQADTICSAGGFSGAKANFVPTPQTDCPKIEDPLKDRSAPPVGSCTPIPLAANAKGDVSKNEINRTVDLEPATYCGLTISQNAVVTLKPGIFVVKDGPLIVKDKSTLQGDGVAFYFTGNKAGLLFDKDTTIDLRAPVSGTMAGLLISEQRAVSAPVDPVTGLVGVVVAGLLPPPTPPPVAATKPMRTYRIISNNARNMLGTIYLPAGRLVIDADRPVADRSAYTVVVAQQVNLFEGPNLFLNANYTSTSVPVPKGVGPLSGKLLLAR